MDYTTVGRTVGWWLLRWGAVKWPERIARWLYPDHRLAENIQIQAMRAGEGATLSVETVYGVHRLVVRLGIDNFSPYREIVVNRLIGSIDRLVNFVYEGWAVGQTGASIIMIDVALTAEQANRLRQMGGSVVEIKGAAKLICDRRAIKKDLRITATVQIAS